jgi:YVTN family beta-propeller protein
MKNHLPLALVAAFASVFVSGCWWDDCGGGTPTGGFTVTAVDKLYTNCSRPNCTGPNPFPAVVPHPGAQVSGDWQCDVGLCNGGPFGGFSSYGSVYLFGITSQGQAPVFTDRNGEASIANGRINAIWQGSVVAWGSPACAQPSATGQFYVLLTNPFIDWACAIAGGGVVGPSPAFVLANSIPSSITLSHPGLALTTASGMPGLRIYNENGVSTEFLSASGGGSGCPALVIEPPPPPGPEATATSVSTDGSTATFPFPKLSDGSPLPTGFYGFNVWNQSSPGNFVDMGMGFFGVGSNNTSNTTPFGVDAANVTVSSMFCSVVPPGRRVCQSGGTSTTPQAILTLSSQGKVTFRGGAITVGSQPVSVKGYAVTTKTVLPDHYGGYIRTTEPSRAIVANFGGNTVNIVDLNNYVVVQTISVGTQPAALVLKGDQSKAYVANYGSSTVSEIDLAANTQSRVAAVGTQPEAVAMDPGGTALWVGGLNYISKLDLGSFIPIQSLSVSGQVTSLAVSSGQNSLVYTTMAAASGSTTFQAHQADISSGAVQGTYAQYSVSSSSPHPEYAEAITVGGSAPGTPGWLMPSGALVSANYGNSVVVVGTPTGFAVIDLIRQIDLLDGTTPTPVRGVATDPAQGVAYVTLPDSNSLITVPLPVQHTAAKGTVTISGTELTVNYDPCLASSQGRVSCPQTAPDSGNVWVMVADAAISSNYGQGDTAASVAARLAAAINATGFPVTASVNGSVLSLAANRLGPGANQWPLQVSCASNLAQYGIGCSFSASPSGATLGGGN